MAQLVGKDFGTKFVIASKGAGCKYCMQLEMFLQHALDGALDADITVIKQEDDPETYDAIKDFTGAMSAPMFVNTETGEHISGFDAAEVIEFTGVEV